VMRFTNHIGLPHTEPTLHFCCVFMMLSISHCGPGSSVGIATDYALEGLGSNPGGDEIFRPSRPP